MTDKKIWFVTGAARGMGVDIATAALAAGHAVVATARDADAVTAALGTSGDVLAVQLDITDPSVDAAITAAVAPSPSGTHGTSNLQQHLTVRADWSYKSVSPVVTAREEIRSMLMRTDPFRELDRVAQQVFGTAARPAAMPIDAYRKGDEFVVLLDLPGCDPASINLTVERNVLTVHAERSRPGDDDVELLIGERPIGTFSRQLFLAETLDSERIAADYTDGVLRLRVPVKEQAKPRRVDIAVGGGQPTSIEASSHDGSNEPVGSGVS